MRSFLNIETHAGEPVTFRGAKLVPFSQSWQVRFPGLSGGLIWNRPASVLLVGADGEEQVLPVHDPTRLVIWALSGAILLMGSLLWAKTNHKTEEN